MKALYKAHFITPVLGQTESLRFVMERDANYNILLSIQEQGYVFIASDTELIAVPYHNVLYVEFVEIDR